MNPTTFSPSGNLNNLLIERKAMKPLWIFADEWDGEHTGGKFCCFIGAHYPIDIWSMDVTLHKGCLERLKSGAWKLEQQQENPKSAIGYGFGRTPSEAFREACYSAGYIKRATT